MILRPLDEALVSPESSDYLPAWPVIEKIQRTRHDGCWLITQPSHAALSGDIAQALSAPQFPALDAQLVRTIALHDAGWGSSDAQAIQRSRTEKNQFRPQSFVETPLAESLAAWEKSIETGETVCAAGGYAVSRHFDRIANARVNSAGENATGRPKLESFIHAEENRRKKLVARQERAIEDLERVAEMLQLCDLLSLYICCGTRQNVVFPEYSGVQLRITNEANGIRISPGVITGGTEFRVAALRHPALRELSSREIVTFVL